ncbi:hypothetical protein [Blastococcus sp. SYSU D00820]
MPPRDGSPRTGSPRTGSARRTGSGRDRAPAGRRGSAADARSRSGSGRSAGAVSPRRGSARGAGRPEARPAATEALVLGDPPVGARVAGALLVLAGLAGAAAVVPTYLVVGGRAISLATGLGGVLVTLLVPLVSLAVGGVLAGGRIPKFGLSYAAIAGALSLGSLLLEVYRGSSSTLRPGEEVLAGEWLLTSSVRPGAGWWLALAGLGLTVLAGAVAAGTWGRTVMEDGGTLDPARPGLAGLAGLLGVGTVLCLALPAADVPDRLVTDPATLVQTVVEQPGPQALLERPGLALLGGLLLAGAVVLCSVLAPSLRPRLATVGGLLAIAAVVLSLGLTGARDAVVSEDLEWTLPGAGLLVAGCGYAGLTVLAWRLRRGRPAGA